jgi:VIT1/CCC1 family predicted Fe2+/Mn2+ transporter
MARESAEHWTSLSDLIGAAGEPWHRVSSGGFLRNVVYGFNDGLTANFGLIAGVIGAAVEPRFVVVSGIAGLLADSLSMGASGYLAAKSQQEVYTHEIELERQEIDQIPELEEEEMALIYQARGMEPRQARLAAAELMRQPQQALAEKVREELKISPAAMSPLREGLVTGIATAIGALIPVAPFFFLPATPAIGASFAISMASHFAVGAARSFFTGRSLLRSGTDMFAVGLGVAVLGYLVGDLLSWLF